MAAWIGGASLNDTNLVYSENPQFNTILGDISPITSHVIDDFALKYPHFCYHHNRDWSTASLHNRPTTKLADPENAQFGARSWDFSQVGR